MIRCLAQPRRVARAGDSPTQHLNDLLIRSRPSFKSRLHKGEDLAGRAQTAPGLTGPVDAKLATALIAGDRVGGDERVCQIQRGSRLLSAARLPENSAVAAAARSFYVPPLSAVNALSPGYLLDHRLCDNAELGGGSRVQDFTPNMRRQRLQVTS